MESSLKGISMEKSKILWELGGFISHKWSTQVSTSHWKQASRHFRKNQLTWFHIHSRISHLTATVIFKQRARDTFFLWINILIVAFQTMSHKCSHGGKPRLVPRLHAGGHRFAGGAFPGWPAPTSGKKQLSAPWTRSGHPGVWWDMDPMDQGAPHGPHRARSSSWTPWDEGVCRPSCRKWKTQGHSISRSLPFQILQHNSVGCTKTWPASARAKREMRIVCRQYNYLAFPPAGSGRG